MGSISAQGFAEQVEEGNVSLRAALSWHLTSNHYPPLPTVFIDTCIAAIEAGQDEDFDLDVALPEGVEWKDGRDVVRAGDFIESFHLASFL